MRSAEDDLRALDLFSETSRSEMALVARQLTMLRVPAGKVLMREGQRGNEFMIIAEGHAEVRQGGRTIATIGRGDLVGEMALLQRDGDGRRNATVTTVTDAVIYVGSPREFRQIISSAPSVTERCSEPLPRGSPPPPEHCGSGAEKIEKPPGPDHPCPERFGALTEGAIRGHERHLIAAGIVGDDVHELIVATPWCVHHGGAVELPARRARAAPSRTTTTGAVEPTRHDRRTHPLDEGAAPRAALDPPPAVGAGADHICRVDDQHGASLSPEYPVSWRAAQGPGAAVGLGPRPLPRTPGPSASDPMGRGPSGP